MRNIVLKGVYHPIGIDFVYPRIQVTYDQQPPIKAVFSLAIRPDGTFEAMYEVSDDFAHEESTVLNYIQRDVEKCFASVSLKSGRIFDFMPERTIACCSNVLPDNLTLLDVGAWTEEAMANLYLAYKRPHDRPLFLFRAMEVLRKEFRDEKDASEFDEWASLRRKSFPNVATDFKSAQISYLKKRVDEWDDVEALACLTQKSKASRHSDFPIVTFDEFERFSRMVVLALRNLIAGRRGPVSS